MRIWIDGYEANVGQRLGSSQVAFELLKHFEKIDHKNEYTVLLPNPPLDDLPKERVGWKYKVLKPNRLWTRIALPLALFLSRPRPDLIFSPTHYIPRFSPVKRIVTIFDLAYLNFSQMFAPKDLWQLKNWTKFSILNSDHIITISSNTKKDILKEYQIPKNKITVALPGFDPNVFKPIKNKVLVQKMLKKYEINGDYIVYIGTIQPRKNLIRLIESFKNIKNLKLIIVGKIKGEGRQAWMFKDIIKKPRELGIEDRVIFTGFVSTEQLPYLLSGALAFILPSLYEGFGIPVVEAMASGTPVIVSNVSSLPEVVGEAGLLIDPYSVTQMEQAIRTISTDKKLRSKKSTEGLKQAKKFSWDKMAKTVLKVFEETLK